MEKVWDQEKMNKYSPSDVLRWRIFKDYASRKGMAWEVIAIFDESADGFVTLGTYYSHEEAVAEVDRLDSLSDEKGGNEETE